MDDMNDETNTTLNKTSGHVIKVTLVLRIILCLCWLAYPSIQSFEPAIELLSLIVILYAISIA